MRYANLKWVLLKMGLILLCAGMVMPTATCLAQENDIELPDFYPDSFSGQGCIDSITFDRAVIDDRLMTFAIGATFHTPKLKEAAWSTFSEGHMAGYVKNEANEITSFWYIQDCR